MRSIATYDHTGFIDYLDVFNSAVDNYTTLTVAAGKKVSFELNKQFTNQLIAFRRARCEETS